MPLLAFLLTNGFSPNYHYRADAFGHDFAAFVKSRGGVNGWPRKKAHMDLLYTVFAKGVFEGHDTVGFQSFGQALATWHEIDGHGIWFAPQPSLERPAPVRTGLPARAEHPSAVGLTAKAAPARPPMEQVRTFAWHSSTRCIELPPLNNVALAGTWLARLTHAFEQLAVGLRIMLDALPPGRRWPGCFFHASSFYPATSGSTCDTCKVVPITTSVLRNTSNSNSKPTCILCHIVGRSGSRKRQPGWDCACECCHRTRLLQGPVLFNDAWNWPHGPGRSLGDDLVAAFYTGYGRAPRLIVRLPPR